MDDPWADTPSTPQTNSTPKASVDITRPVSSTSPEPLGLDPETKLEEETVQAFNNEAPESDIPISTKISPIPVEGDEEGFDDFDDFDAPDAGPSFSMPDGEDGGFGDFGDFEEGDFTDEPEVEAETGLAGPVVVVEQERERKWVCLSWLGR